MAKNSGIAWTDHTFNPWWGCVRVSEGCTHCYAESMAKRTGHDIWGVDKPHRFFSEKHWKEPLAWNDEAEKARKRAYVFCASMADVFEKRDDLIEERKKLWPLIESTPWLIWLLLTKRPENVIEMVPTGWKSQGSPKNVWYGITTENQTNYDKRINTLQSFRRELDAHKIWLSIEPQIGAIDLRGMRPDWVIVGGESGAGCRPFDLEWGRSLKQQCDSLGIAFFMKQLGGFPDKRHEMSDFPEDLRVRDFPKG